ncbi:hypothetical protein Tco_0256962, partial [Tanacetum coccineum]
NSAIKNLEEKVIRLAHALAVRKVKRDTPIKSGIPTPDSSNPVKQECAMKLEPPRETPIQKVETFTEKEIDDFGRPEGLKEILMNDDKNGDLGNFLKDNDLLPDLRIDDFVEGIDDLWKDLDPEPSLMMYLIHL